MGTEKGPDFYDETFRQHLHWKEHYSKSPYFPVWQQVIKRIKEHSDNGIHNDIIELGCGSGQLTQYLSVAIPNMRYLGIDFSPERINHARQREYNGNPYLFVEGDVHELSESFEQFKSNIFIATEFFEHVQKDKEIIRAIPSGCPVIFTVPSFDYDSHVRYFPSELDVNWRYSSLFNGLRIMSLWYSKARIIYVCDGIRK